MKGFLFRGLWEGFYFGVMGSVYILYRVKVGILLEVVFFIKIFLIFGIGFGVMGIWEEGVRGGVLR